MAEKKLSKIRFLLKTRTLIKYFQNRKKEKALLNSNCKTDEEYIREFFKLRFGKYPCFEHPLSFNEKLNWEKLHWRSDLAKKCADKFEVREYVKSRGLEAYLNPLFGVYDHIEEVDWNDIPNEFVIKTTNDSGSVFVCRNKKDANRLSHIIADISCAMDEPPYNHTREWVYEGGKRRIVIERLIETKDGHSPRDYKFFCFNGHVKCLYVGSNRDSDIRFDFFDRDWNHLNVYNGHLHAGKMPDKPKNLTEMIRVAEALSEGFAHVRVDLYSENETIIFGEMTFFHFGGLTPFYPDSFDEWLGKDFDLSVIPTNEII